MPRLRDVVHRLLHRPAQQRALAPGGDQPVATDAELFRAARRRQARRAAPVFLGGACALAGLVMTFGPGPALIVFGGALLLIGLGSEDADRGR